MLKHIDACIEHVAPLSPVALEALAVLSKREVDVNEAVAALGREQTLAARVLRLANSPFYGCARRIATLREAFVVLGTRTLYQAVMAAAVMRSIEGDESEGMQRWRHSLSAAQAARVVAQSVGVDEDVAATAGLLHDIGKIVLITCGGSEYRQLREGALREGKEMFEAEQTALGIDHSSVGSKVALRWRLPPDLVDAIARHHHPDSGKPSRLVDITHVADVLAHAVDEQDERPRVPLIAEAAWRRLGIPQEEFVNLLDAIDVEVES